MTLSKRQEHSHQAKNPAINFEALFDKHWDRLCRLLYSLTGDMDDAQDLAMEAFIQLHRRPPDRLDNPGGWLYRTATNRGLNALRSHKRRQGYEDQASIQVLDQVRESLPEGQVERNEIQEHVRFILSQMKPRAAQILLMRYSGFSYREIAAAVNIAPGSVGTLLARAERSFEKIYSEPIEQA